MGNIRGRWLLTSSGLFVLANRHNLRTFPKPDLSVTRTSSSKSFNDPLSSARKSTPRKLRPQRSGETTWDLYNPSFGADPPVRSSEWRGSRVYVNVEDTSIKHKVRPTNIISNFKSLLQVFLNVQTCYMIDESGEKWNRVVPSDVNPTPVGSVRSIYLIKGNGKPIEIPHVGSRIYQSVHITFFYCNLYVPPAGIHLAGGFIGQRLPAS
ncbi:hypothetical protein EVAR_82622_1 [Eumeta japonica]|uniref:Uncharacterized protein n=1 Tax=Eumeta variegata TaxID=151549 RepID=A0A4C1X4C1_EUMVA|nr:hypothetical protein EVAR_82622_1 [Eumeta japonica]